MKPLLRAGLAFSLVLALSASAWTSKKAEAYNLSQTKISLAGGLLWQDVCDGSLKSKGNCAAGPACHAAWPTCHDPAFLEMGVKKSNLLKEKKNGAARKLSIYVPGQEHTLTLTAPVPGAINGFQMSARDARGNSVGTFTGGENSQVYEASEAKKAVELIENTHGVTKVSSWTFKWTAPKAGTGAVKFYYSMVSGNNNGTSTDDTTYYGVASMKEGAALNSLKLGMLPESNALRGSNMDLTGSRLGSSGCFVDVNGDGLEDLVAGATGGNGSKVKKGAALVYLRKSAKRLSSEYSLLAAGEKNGDSFGSAAANVGDVNGDGEDDFAVAAVNAAGEASLSGAVYVYQGGQNPPVLLAKLGGKMPLDKFGFSLAGGDINGDGTNDVIVGAPYAASGYFQSGAVYVYYGGKAISTSPSAVIGGPSVNANIGKTVASGDINGDGHDDIFINAGAKVLVYYGAKKFKAKIENDDSPDVTIRSDTGGKSGSGFGTSIACLGDVNGDGIDDVAIGNPNRSTPATYDNKGSVYIFKGSAGLPSEFFEDDSNYRLSKILGDSVGDRFGSSIALAGDIDGKGTPDILVGARWASGGTESSTLLSGKVYLFHGEILLEDPSAVLTPSRARKGYSITTASGEYGNVLCCSEDVFFTGAPLVDNNAGMACHTRIQTGQRAN
ncbi:MAG: FG-GAP repeat protein [Nitrospinae bacterium]|nr:FG-GAP repeat protein [Nitrospinota bacterium]